MKVLLVGSEVAPLIKIGGLGDVMGSLPKALSSIGVNIDVITPFYPSIDAKHRLYKTCVLQVPFGNSFQEVSVYKTILPNSSVDVYLLRNDYFFGSLYHEAFRNNVEETQIFTFFDKSVVEFLKSQLNTYDLVHCNDWHTGLITHFLEDEFNFSRPATLFTIHNASYQGKGNESLIQSAGINPLNHPLFAWDMSNGDINFVIQGISSSDYVNTVSPSYAQELLMPEYGEELSDILLARSGRFTGILNGVDYDAFPRKYEVYNAPEAKKLAKANLYRRLNIADSLDSWLNRPLFSYIGRLDPGQKGLDLLEKLHLEYQVNKDSKDSPFFVLLGKGDIYWEEKFMQIASKYDNHIIDQTDKGVVGVSNVSNSSDSSFISSPNSVKKSSGSNLSVFIGFDEELAQEIYAGSDFILVPSKYEPCGLIQMIAMHYGTLPIVRKTGGLKDTVVNGVNGFVFERYDIDSLNKCVKRALNAYNDKHIMELMIRNAMLEDFSWSKSAAEYKKLYEKIILMRNVRVSLK